MIATNLKAAIRMAVKIHEALDQASYAPRPRDTLLDEITLQTRRLDRLRHRHQMASQHRWQAAEVRTRHDLFNGMSHLQSVLAVANDELRSPASTAPSSSLRELLEELTSLDEFDEVGLDARAGKISVTTEPIELEGLSLGRFRIILDLKRWFERWGSGSMFTVEAVEPNPSDADETITHPHVRDRSPCLGDATVPLQLALQQGRLNDAFRLIDRMLHTYNPQSAYTSVHEWHDLPCDDCGDRCSSDNLTSCSGCGQSLCNDCGRCCDGCEQTYCYGCVTASPSYTLCEDCCGHCSECSALLPQHELDDCDGLCPTCHERQEQEEPEDTSTPTPQETHDSQTATTIVA